MENGEWLREIHFKDSKNELESVTRFEVSLPKEETIITKLDKNGKEIAREIGLDKKEDIYDLLKKGI